MLPAVALGASWVVRTLVADRDVLAWTVLGYLTFRFVIFLVFVVRASAAGVGSTGRDWRAGELVARRARRSKPPH